MYIGHYGAGFAGRKVMGENTYGRISLGTLFLASQFLDLLFPLLVLIGVENLSIEPGNTVLTPLNLFYYPFSHSLFSAIIWAFLFGSIYYIIKKNKKGSLVLGGLVLSHWLLDFITHRPDLQLVPWRELRVGLGLWNFPVPAIILEMIIFLIGFYFYTEMTKAINLRGIFLMWGMFLFLLLTYSANIFGTSPPSVKAFAYIGLSQWLIIAWGYWIDRNRVLISEG